MLSSILSTFGLTQDVFWILVGLSLIPFWLGCTWLYALSTGWWQLARRFPAPTFAKGETFKSSILLRRAEFPLRFHKSVIVRVGSKGIGLSTPAFLHLLCPPIFIPWRAIAQCRQMRHLGLIDAAEIEIAGLGTRVVLRGIPAEAVFRCCSGEPLERIFNTDPEESEETAPADTPCLAYRV